MFLYSTYGQPFLNQENSCGLLDSYCNSELTGRLSDTATPLFQYYLLHLHFGNWISLFHDGGCYNIETRPVICYANQWTGF